MCTQYFMEDIHYIKETLRGNTAAFEVLVNRYKDMVYSIAHHFSFSKEENDELAQSIFVKTYENLSSFKANAKFSTWLYKIAYNTALTASKKQKRNVYFDDLEEYAHPHDATENALHSMIVNEQLDMLKLEVAKLSPEEQSLIDFFYHENLSVADISGITNMSESNVKTKLHRIRHKLGEVLKPVFQGKF